MWQFWVDRGGTFTDLVGLAPDGGLHTHKLLSENPEQYKDAAIQGVHDLMGIAAGEKLPPHSISAVKMGTTVATNALLERKGERTLLLVTRGLRDLLRIGYQNRPDIFALNIQLPELLYSHAEEVQERLAADGSVIEPLDEDSARTALQSAFDDGYRGVAIAFMHAYLNPGHEQRVAEIAAEIGFTQISTSNETSPLIKLVGRGDTAVVDAYLTPILRRYVEQVSDALGVEPGGKQNACERLMFMQSNGGLTDARLFQGKDAILSGPAGGVVGMVKTAELAGYDKIIGFDMGGTSTDVTHYAGEYERSFETEVAGVRMRAPMMNIHTVAAGGGSILKFEDGRYQVGPESAGANPGPACYRRGGPLTVTDCNVMLGKLNPDHFPSVFGPNADEKLDAAIVREKFDALAQEIARSNGKEPLSPEETAVGFLRIAIENMANAIKKISVQRGYDVTQYTLNCFGGAGGQHACLVADALGMDRVFLHPFAGVLSAYGMGLAQIRALRERQMDCSITDHSRIESAIQEMSEAARAEVVLQGVGTSGMEIRATAHLRYDGSHTALEVTVGTEAEMAARFEAAHKSRFGFVPTSRKLTVEMLTVEAVAAAEEITTADLPAASAEPNSLATVRMHTGEAWADAPLYDRASLAPGHLIEGPAIITETTGTNIVEAGWRAGINSFGDLILERATQRASRVAIGTNVDPIMLEVFNNLYMNIAEQMGLTLEKTAYSVNIKERLDFSCAIFDGSGALVANAPHVPVHLGAMSASVETVIARNPDMKPGDSYMLNAPFSGGTHLPDVTVITPVFGADNKPNFFVGSRGHHADIGGRTPGSGPPDSKHIEEEGVVIDNFKLVDEGKLREAETRALLASGRYPCRNIDDNMADLEAQIAANETGLREVRRMIDNFGLDVVQAYMRHVQDNAEESVRRVIGALSDGAFTHQLDIGQQIQVRIEVDREARTAVIDFTGTSEQGQNNYNCPLAVCRAAVLYVFRTLVGTDIPLNEGCLKPLTIIAPEGTMINAQYPAAVIAGNTEVSQAVTHCLYGALGTLACSQSTMNNFIWGTDRYQNYETICGGAGAGPAYHGESAVHTHMTNTRMTDPEILEQRFPVRVEEFSIRQGSGGEGAFKGGHGIIRRLKFLEPMTVTTLCSHRIIPPFGVDGGAPGKLGIEFVERQDGTREAHPGNAEAQLEAGDIFHMETPGGGGFGKA